MSDPLPEEPRPGLLFRPLWTLGEAERKRQTCQLALALPFACLGGMAYGMLWSRQMGGLSLGLVGLGAAGLPVLVYLQIVLTPPAAHLMARLLGQRFEGLAELAWDGLSGGAAAFLASRFLGLDILPAVGLAGALGALYAGGLAYALCGGGATDLVGFWSGAGSRSAPRKSDYSYPAALADRGLLEEALDEYRTLISADPADPEPYLLSARLCRERLRDHREEARWLEKAREDAQLSRQQELMVGRRLVDLWRVNLGQPRKAAPELARLAERFPESETGAWAQSELEALKEEMAREMGREPER